MSRTVVATIVKTITLEDDYANKSDEDIVEMSAAALRFDGIGKTFPGVKALDVEVSPLKSIFDAIKKVFGG